MPAESIVLLASICGRAVRWKAVNGFSTAYRGITNYGILQGAALPRATSPGQRFSNGTRLEYPVPSHVHLYVSAFSNRVIVLSSASFFSPFLSLLTL